MHGYRPLQKPLAIVGIALLLTGTAAAQERVSVQKLLERGELEQAMQRADAERENPESTYLAAQAAAKLGDAGRVVDQYGRLSNSSDEAWKAIGESGARFAQGDLNAAMEAANRAANASGDNPYAHYQVGIVASRQNNFQRAAEALTRATELKPDFAYAHYYAALNFQRLKQTAKMTEHFDAFLRLAPDAPERSSVTAIMRTLRPHR